MVHSLILGVRLPKKCRSMRIRLTVYRSGFSILLGYQTQSIVLIWGQTPVNMQNSEKSPQFQLTIIINVFLRVISIL